MSYQESNTRELTMNQSTAFPENSVADKTIGLDYQPPELIEIDMLDESAVGFSGQDEPFPPE